MTMIIKKILFGMGVFVTLSSMQIQANNSYEIILNPRKFTDYLPDWVVSWKRLTTQDRVRRMYIGTNSYIHSLFKKTWIPWTKSAVDKFVHNYSNFINRYKDIIDKPFIVYDSIDDYNKYKKNQSGDFFDTSGFSELKSAVENLKLKIQYFDNIEDVWRRSPYRFMLVGRNKFVIQAYMMILDNIDSLASKSIQKRLKLPEDASDQQIHNEYIKQIEYYDPQNIEEEVKKGELSQEDVSRTILYGKRLKEAYAKYNAQPHKPIQLEPNSLRKCLNLFSFGDNVEPEKYISYVRAEYEKFMNNFDPAKLSKLVAKGFLSEEDVIKIRKSADYLKRLYEKEYGTK